MNLSDFETEYLLFTDLLVPMKTLRIAIHSARSGDKLGMIRWYGAWRQYTFHPDPDTIWNPACLDTVNAVMRALMAERKA